MQGDFFLYLVLKGVRSILEDGGLSISTPCAIVARSIAPTVISRCEDPQNESSFCRFAEGLVTDLTTCFVYSPTLKPHLQREYMWHQYHSIRTSASFKRKWADFVLTCGEVSAIVYLHSPEPRKLLRFYVLRNHASF